jgi:hypothetical protein
VRRQKTGDRRQEKVGKVGKVRKVRKFLPCTLYLCS